MNGFIQTTVFRLSVFPYHYSCEQNHHDSLILSLNQQLIDVWIKSLGRLKFNVIKLDVIRKVNSSRETKRSFLNHIMLLRPCRFPFSLRPTVNFVRGNQFNFIAKKTHQRKLISSDSRFMELFFNVIMNLLYWLSVQIKK